MHGSKLNQEATNTYIKSYSAKIVEDFFSQNEGISGQQIISVTPVKQVNFFILKALFDEWQDEIKKFKSPYFDYQSEDVNEALKSLVNTLSKNISIQKNDFLPLLKRAVASTLTLLYYPAAYYIKEFAKVETSEKPRELKAISKYIKLYRPLYDEILDGLEMDQEFESVVKHAVIKHQHNTDFEQTIEQFNLTLPLNIEKQVIKEETPKPKPVQVAEARHASSREEKHVNDINEEFRPLEDLEDEDEDALTSNVNERFSEDIKTLNQRYEEKEKARTVAAVHESKSLSNLKNNININQRYMFVNDLFDGNEKDYELAMDEVENCESFDSSVELLVQNYSKKYDWEMNSEEVKELLKVIFKRFR